VVKRCDNSCKVGRCTTYLQRLLEQRPFTSILRKILPVQHHPHQ
jgi:hypothetical protein